MPPHNNEELAMKIIFYFLCFWNTIWSSCTL